MKTKFLLLMILLVIVLTICLVLPLTQIQINSLTNLSKDSTKNAISIIAYTAGSNFPLYYTGDDKEKRDFVIKLQQSIAVIKGNWKDAIFISVLDREGKIIANSNATEIGRIYDDYKNFSTLEGKIKKQLDRYQKDIERFPNNAKLINSEILKLEDKLKNIENSNDSIIIETKINEYKRQMELLIRKVRLGSLALSKKEAYPLSALTESIFIDGSVSYTIIFPIIIPIGDKFGFYGNIIASISLEFIKKEILKIIIIALSIALFVLIISFFIIQFYTKIIIQPIIYLTNAVKQVASGNLDMKVPVSGKDEIAVLGSEFNSMIRIWREKLHMEKYVSKSTADMISKVETGEYSKEPRRENITVFFSDVRGFTTYSENHDPLVVVKNLNAIFDIQVAVIEKYQGDIDKFVGDEIMATFSTPKEAFKAALDIQKELEKFNNGKDEKLQIGIGINFGEAIVGSIGSGDYLDWTAIGDTVNLGARLCGFSPAGKVVISEQAFSKIKTELKGEESTIQVKGKQKNIKVYIF